MQKQSEYNKAYEERKKAKGYVWLRVFVPSVYKQKITDFINQVKTKYEEENDEE